MLIVVMFIVVMFIVVSLDGVPIGLVCRVPFLLLICLHSQIICYQKSIATCINIVVPTLTLHISVY